MFFVINIHTIAFHFECAHFGPSGKVGVFTIFSKERVEIPTELSRYIEQGDRRQMEFTPSLLESGHNWYLSPEAPRTGI